MSYRLLFNNKEKHAGRTPMTGPEGGDTHLEMTAEERQPDEVVKLIRKLRWIGLESEAKELQHVLEGLPPARRGSLVAAPHSTD
jgi:hypothetical protein